MNICETALALSDFDCTPCQQCNRDTYTVTRTAQLAHRMPLRSPSPTLLSKQYASAIGNLYCAARLGLLKSTDAWLAIRKHRQHVRQIIGDRDFIETYCHCPVAICETHVVRGLYKKAR